MTYSNEHDRRSSSSGAGTPIVALVDREAAVRGLVNVAKLYINEQYDGTLDRTGLVMELQVIAKEEGALGKIQSWMRDILEAPAMDVIIALMMAWADCTPEDYSELPNYTWQES